MTGPTINAKLLQLRLNGQRRSEAPHHVGAPQEEGLMSTAVNPLHVLRPCQSLQDTPRFLSQWGAAWPCWASPVLLW